MPDEEIRLYASETNGVPPPRYQWYLNRQAIAGETNAGLHLVNLQLEDAGVYSVMVSNFVDVQWETNAVVTVIEPLELRDAEMTPDGMFSFWVYGPTGQVFTVEKATVLDGAGTWMPLLTNQLDGGRSHFVAPAPATDQGRFYRASTQTGKGGGLP